MHTLFGFALFGQIAWNVKARVLRTLFGLTLLLCTIIQCRRFCPCHGRWEMVVDLARTWWYTSVRVDSKQYRGQDSRDHRRQHCQFSWTLRQEHCHATSKERFNYKGVDQRVRDYLITHEISIGNYVLSGGELAAAVFCDCIIRLIPGVLGDESSALTDSFQDDLLAPPIYTRPAEYNGWKVPKILTSGNTPKINEWREKKALEITRIKRPDLLK